MLRMVAVACVTLSFSASVTLFPALASEKPSSKQTKSNLPAGFSFLRDVAPSILQDMRYASRNNFTGNILPGYRASECILQSSVAKALLNVQAELKATGYSLKVYDCYRPARAVQAFGSWAQNSDNSSTKDYYPRLPKTALFAKGYIARRSSHSIGTAIDLTLVRLPATAQQGFDPATPRKACNSPFGERPQDNSIDMGTAFDCFDVMSHTNHPAINGKVRANRHRLRTVMTRFGFSNYHREWWHYSYKKRSLRTYQNFIIPWHPAAKRAQEPYPHRPGEPLMADD